MDEWLSLFDDPILGNSTLDRLATVSYQIVIEGASCREKLSPPPEAAGRQGSNCLESQDRATNSGVAVRQVEPCFSMELRMSSSLRMQAVRASFFGLPRANSRW